MIINLVGIFSMTKKSVALFARFIKLPEEFSHLDLEDYSIYTKHFFQINLTKFAIRAFIIFDDSDEAFKKFLTFERIKGQRFQVLDSNTEECKLFLNIVEYDKKTYANTIGLVEACRRIKNVEQEIAETDKKLKQLYNKRLKLVEVHNKIFEQYLQKTTKQSAPLVKKYVARKKS